MSARDNGSVDRHVLELATDMHAGVVAVSGQGRSQAQMNRVRFVVDVATVLEEQEVLLAVRGAVTFDQDAWQLEQVESGEVGLARNRQVDDWVSAQVAAEVVALGEEPRFVVRAVVVDAYDAVWRQETTCSGVGQAAGAADEALRAVLRVSSRIAASRDRSC